ncbi:MAG TPA: M2 family metallopeptidase [Thermoanaerobaculia bacterium]|nr:M2 family metallopeptidase [Thermoanaerobaculia bacterium]
MTRVFLGFRLPAACVAGAGLLLTLAAGPVPAAWASSLEDAGDPQAGSGSQRATSAKPTVDEARKFVEEANRRLLALAIEASEASWVQATFITHDTSNIAARANEKLTVETVRLAKEAAKFNGLQLPAEIERQLNLIKLGLTLPAPADPQKSSELSRIAVSLDGMYGAGEFCLDSTGKDGKKECFDIQTASTEIEEGRDPKRLQDIWVGWHSIAIPMRKDYQRMVELANEGSRELGYKDTGALWRSKYDMPPDDFAKEVDRLWGQVKPVYDALHCHVRAKLNEKYGDQIVPLDQPIPAHLLGNMWAQSWDNIYDLVAPPKVDLGYDLTENIVAKKLDAKEMVRYGERFFTSIGFEPLPETFWERSQFVQPVDHEAICHASAWDVDYKNDLRIKMCIEPNREDFSTIHHELGHNMYQRAYNNLPFLFQDSANDGFHEALGDTVSLSITPEYLKQVGLIEQVPDPSKDLGLLMDQALEKIAFLPFGVLIDQWRWQVFSGQIKPEDYNKAWWELRRKYQGVRPPVARTEEQFDPGAKYHVPGNTPYTRYFLAQIQQYQFHKALCEAAGNKGPLHRCSIYGNKEAGRRLQEMMAMGASRPWPEAMKALTGQEQHDGRAIVDYFAPLKTWLDEQNKGEAYGW